MQTENAPSNRQVESDEWKQRKMPPPNGERERSLLSVNVIFCNRCGLPHAEQFCPRCGHRQCLTCAD